MPRPIHKYAIIDKLVYKFCNFISHKLKKYDFIHPNFITLSTFNITYERKKII
jgi:hypothetical protein